MKNINATLIHGQIMAWLDKSGADIRPHERTRIDLRVYPPNSTIGCYVVLGHGPIRWYWDADPSDGHYNVAKIEDVQAALDAGAKIQVIGPRGVSFGVWDSWGKFLEAINAV